MPVRSEGMSWNGKWSATRWSRQDRARVVQGLVFGVLGIAGAYVASRLSATVAPAALLAAFSVLMLVVAAMMVACRRAQLRAADAGEVETGSPVGPVLQLRPTLVCDCPRVLKVVAVASAVGLLAGFFGVGGVWSSSRHSCSHWGSQCRWSWSPHY
jgi:uncharacterized membrane protein YfcA